MPARYFPCLLTFHARTGGYFYAKTTDGGGVGRGGAAVGGLSANGAGLYSIGIPKDSILTYETALKTDNFLLVAHGIAEDVAKARDILRTTRALELELRAGEPPTRSATVQVGAEEV